MKPGVVSLLIALLLAAWPATSWAALDELDELLSTPPSSVEQSSPGFLDPDYSRPAETSEQDGRRWQHATGPAANEPSVSVPATLDEQEAEHSRERRTAAPVNAVPEPSAWLLAGAALLYLLVFGRRRRTI